MSSLTIDLTDCNSDDSDEEQEQPIDLLEPNQTNSWNCTAFVCIAAAAIVFTMGLPVALNPSPAGPSERDFCYTFVYTQSIEKLKLKFVKI